MNTGSFLNFALWSFDRRAPGRRDAGDALADLNFICTTDHEIRHALLLDLPASTAR